MSAQIIYFARHGLTEANERQAVQDAHDPLSKQGHLQAERLAKRAKHIKFDHLIASDMLRAQQTAGYVANMTGHMIITEPLVREVMRSEEYHGLAHDSDEYRALIADEVAHLSDPTWRAGKNGQNFFDTRDRALQALEKFESYGEDTLFVVSHGHFIRCLVGTVMMEKDLTPSVWNHLSRTLRTHNTGITILRREIETNHWMLVSLNDHAHFADN